MISRSRPATFPCFYYTPSVCHSREPSAWPRPASSGHRRGHSSPRSRQGRWCSSPHCPPRTCQRPTRAEHRALVHRTDRTALRIRPCARRSQGRMETHRCCDIIRPSRCASFRTLSRCLVAPCRLPSCFSQGGRGCPACLSNCGKQENPRGAKSRCGSRLVKLISRTVE